MITQNLPIYREAKKLRNCIIGLVQHLSKHFKYSVGARLMDCSLDLGKQIRRANEERDPTRRWRHICDLRFTLQDVEDLVDCLSEFKVISNKQVSQVALLTEGIGRQATGWKQSVERQLQARSRQ